MTEAVRERLAAVISSQYRDDQNKLQVITLDPSLEQQIAGGIEHDGRGTVVRMPPPAVEEICRLLASAAEQLQLRSRPPVVLVSPQIRVGLKQLTRGRLPRLVVLSYDEITRDTQVESVEMVGVPALA